MVQNRCIVSIKVEHEVLCTLSNGYVVDDLTNPPKPLQFLHFTLPVLDERRDFTSLIQFDHSTSHLMNDTPSLKRHGYIICAILNFGGLIYI